MFDFASLMCSKYIWSIVKKEKWKRLWKLVCFYLSLIFFISLKPSDFRRGEEHSFILKPATSMWKDLKVLGERSSQLSKPQFGNYASNLGVASKNAHRWKIASTDDQYAVMVSCRCNYTGSLAFPVVSYVIEGC